MLLHPKSVAFQAFFFFFWSWNVCSQSYLRSGIRWGKRSGESMNSDSPLGCILMAQGQLATERRLPVFWRRHLGPQLVPTMAVPWLTFCAPRSGACFPMNLVAVITLLIILYGVLKQIPYVCRKLLFTPWLNTSIWLPCHFIANLEEVNIFLVILSSVVEKSGVL